MSKYGQRKSIGRQEASSDSKGSVLSFSPRVHVLKTQTCIPRYGLSSFATSAGHLCCEQLKLQVLMCPEENQKHGDQESSRQSVSKPLLLSLLSFSLAQNYSQFLQAGSQHASGMAWAQLHPRPCKKPTNLPCGPPRDPMNSRSCTRDQC